jgi:crossover junction endodeoxyribonuclease RusA
MTIWLPMPPTVNTYWRSLGTGKGRVRVIISEAGRKYRAAVATHVLLSGANRQLRERLEVAVVLHPPDRRVRDLDNYHKALLDALTGAGVWCDDSQIDRLSIERGEIWPGGGVRVTVNPIPVR